MKCSSHVPAQLRSLFKRNLPEGAQLTNHHQLQCIWDPSQHLTEATIFPRSSQTTMEQRGGSRFWPFCLRQEESLFIWVPIRLVEIFSELHCSVSFFLSYLSYSLLFTGVQLALPTPVSISHCLTQSLTLVNLLNLQTVLASDAWNIWTDTDLVLS